MAHSFFSPAPLRIFSLFLAILLTSCTAEEKPSEFVAEKPTSPQPVDTKEAVYKGIFASQNSSSRGTFELKTGSGDNLQKMVGNSIGKIFLSTGQIFQASAVRVEETIKSSDFKVVFESDDLSFKFTLDENDQPLITNVLYKDEEGSIIAAEHTGETPVVPLTGTYRCTNCETQTVANGDVELDQNERTFNMMLSNEAGNQILSIQAVLGILVDTQFVIEESCIQNGQYTFCELKSGNAAIGEQVSWQGVHRFIPEGEIQNCSSITGNFTYISTELGSLNGEFKSDNTCPFTTYFVSSAGDDSNSGTSPQDAWKTISKINSLDLKPGDEVLFKGGETFNGNLFLDSKDANNSANPIKISSYGSGKATIFSQSGTGIKAYNTSGIVIDNLIVAGSGLAVGNDGEERTSGIDIYNDLSGNVKLDLITITNSEIYGFRQHGILIGGGNGNSGFSNVLIENNKIHDILDKGIFSFGAFSSTKTGYAHSNLVVRHCEVYNIKGYSKKEHSGNGIVLSDVQHSTIEYSTAYNCGSGNTNCGGPVGIWYYDADYVTIQYNEAYNISSGSGCDGGGFDLDGGVTNGVMQYNYSHDNDGAGFLVGQFSGARPMRNITVRYNISQNDGGTNGGSVYLFNGEGTSDMKDIFVYNNTFYITKRSSNSAPAAIKYNKWNPVTQNINFSNNILYAENGAALVDVPEGYSGNFVGNIYHTNSSYNVIYKGVSYNSLEAFRGTGNEMQDGNPVGYQGRPMLNAAGKGGTIGFGNDLSALTAYKLQADSPAINSGIELPYFTGSQDFYGSNILQSTISDIGAHEDQSAGKRSNGDYASK